MKDKKSSKKSSKSSSRFQTKFWLVTLVLILGPAVLIARSPIFQLNLNKPFNANYIQLPPFIELEGNLAPNTKLENAQYIGHGTLVGPETIVFAPDGSLYTGLMNGQIARVRKDGSIEKLALIGNEENVTFCEEIDRNRLARPNCGRPLGLRLREHWLYVADVFHGIVKVNIKTAEKNVVLSSSDKRFGETPMKFTNDLDLDGDIIYFIDSSSRRDINGAIDEHFEAASNGRLFSYNEKTDTLELLLDNLYFPNGLQSTPNKDALLINELTMARIIKYYVKGEKKGASEVFANLPGFGDTLRLTDHNTLLVPFAFARTNKFTSLLDLTGKLPFIRNILARIVNFHYLFSHLPKYGLVAEYDLNGKPLRSWHDPTGKVVECVTSAVIRDNKVYMGSFYNDFAAVVDY